MMLRRLALMSVALTAVTIACGIPDNSEVSRIQQDDLGEVDDPLAVTTSTTPPTTNEPTTTVAQDVPTTIATDEFLLYFISGAQLFPLRQNLPKGASVNEALLALQAGPGADVGITLRTAVPPEDIAAITVTDDGSGIATVDLPADFYNTIPQDDQRFAIGQIALTVIKAGDFGQVRFTQGGALIAVPQGSGEVGQPGEPLPIRAYHELLEPPVTTTTTVAETTTTALI